MKKSDDPRLTIRPDRRLVTDAGGRRHLLIELTAPEIRVEDDARSPLHLALVIDASGSMTGPPLEAAKAAARGVVESMLPDDRVTLVSFADDVIVHAEGEACGGGGRGRVLDAVDALETRGSTDLAGGWRRGARALEDDTTSGVRRFLVLLSDGHANQGETDPETLGLLAEAMRAREVFTSCVGIGDGYSPVQLEALAGHGGGRLHHAADPDEIVEVVLGELGEVRRTVAEDAAVAFALPPGARVSPLGPWTVRRDGGSHVVPLGALTSGMSRRLVLRVELPAAGEGERLAATAVPSWIVPGEEARREGGAVATEFLVAPAVEVASETPDRDVALEVVSLWQRDAMRRVSLKLEDGDADGAVDLARAELQELKDYARDLPEADPILQELEMFARRVESPVSHMLLRELHTFARKGVVCEADLRMDACSLDELMERE